MSSSISTNENKRPWIVVSACLLGENCKYNGGNNYRAELKKFLADYEVIPICPEVAGGLPTPRVPVELKDGIPFDRDGISREKEFRLGTERTLQELKDKKIAFAILQSRSPSCGVGQIYDGTFSGTKIPGMGMFAAAMKAAGYPVYDVEEVLGGMLSEKK